MSARDRTILSVAGTLLAVAAFWFLALSPKRDDLTKLDAQVTEAQSRLDAAQTKAVAAQAAKARYAKDYATVARLGKAVPPGDDVASLVFQIEDAAKRVDVDFRAVSTEAAAPAAPGSDPASAAGGVRPVPFKFIFEGDYTTIRKLLDKLHRLSRVGGPNFKANGRMMTVDALRLSAGRDGLPDVKAEVNARAYVAEQPAAVAGAAATPTAGTPAAGSSPAPAGATPPATPTAQTAQVTP